MPGLTTLSLEKRLLTKSIKTRHHPTLGSSKRILVEAVIVEAVHGKRSVAFSGRYRPNRDFKHRSRNRKRTLGSKGATLKESGLIARTMHASRKATFKLQVHVSVRAEEA
jgi:hypothetical protein